MTFKIESSGWYRTRDGRLAEVVVNNHCASRYVIGYIVGEDDHNTWSNAGDYLNAQVEHKSDLIEYLGKERPKQPKKFKAKIHLWNNGEVTVTDMKILLVAGLDIVETREIEWEVPDNG